MKQICRHLVTGYPKFQVVYNQNILNNAQTFSFTTFASGKITYATKSGCNPKKADGTSISKLSLTQLEVSLNHLIILVLVSHHRDVHDLILHSTLLQQQLSLSLSNVQLQVICNLQICCSNSLITSASVPLGPSQLIHWYATRESNVLEGWEFFHILLH